MKNLEKNKGKEVLVIYSDNEMPYSRQSPRYRSSVITVAVSQKQCWEKQRVALGHCPWKHQTNKTICFVGIQTQIGNKWTGRKTEASG